MNYFIEKHDMEIILDALEALHEDMKHSEQNGGIGYKLCGYTLEEVDGLYQSLDNSGGERWMKKLRRHSS